MAWTIWYPNMNILFFHLHWTTCQSTVWANGTQNSGLLNFLPESPLLFLQISSNYRKTTAKAWNWYQIWFLTNRTWICTWNILSGKNMTSFSDVPLLPEILHRNGRKNRVTITFRLDFPQNFGKQLTTSTPRFQQTKLQSPPDNSNLKGKSKKVWVIRSSSYWGLKENSRE